MAEVAQKCISSNPLVNGVITVMPSSNTRQTRGLSTIDSLVIANADILFATEAVTDLGVSLGSRFDHPTYYST